LYFAVEDVQGRDDFEEEPKEQVDGFYVKRRSKRSVSVMKHIELLLVADHSLTKYYSDRDLESYLFTIMNMVSVNQLLFYGKRSCEYFFAFHVIFIAMKIQRVWQHD
jgi:hypothetical protein